MTPEEFIERWRGSTRKESAAAQQHFLQLCDMLDVPKPGDEGIPPEDYDFEIAVRKSGGGGGFADVWKRGCFAWEYKGDRKSLVAAYVQVKEYASGLDNPPLLIVSDMSEIQISTNFTNTPTVTHTIQLRDLYGVETRQLLRHAFLDPERLRPDKTPETVTEEAAASIGALATKLRRNNYEPRRVAHFLNKLVFCMFAEDIELLPGYLFTEILEESARKSDLFAPMIGNLFRAMRDRNGLFGTTAIPWFNGGLFDDDDVLPLGHLEIIDLFAAAKLDWSAVEPFVFGTLFEKGLDPARRREMAGLFDARAGSIVTSAARDLFAGNADKGVGIHYTDPATIMKLVEPVVLRPLRREWEAVKGRIADHRAKKERAKSDAVRTREENAARDEWLAFRKRLAAFRVLDPACGSGNFLYLALRHLKDFDLTVIREGREMGLPADDQRITPDAVMGIEINPYAAELAQVTIWIGEIQWQMENGFGVRRSPILGNLANIQCRDALIGPDGNEARWPRADAIIGNPPFVGTKRMYDLLGVEYTKKIRNIFKGRVSPFSDLVCWWFQKALQKIKTNKNCRVGLVATNSIRGGKNRLIIDDISKECVIYDAWPDEPWVIEGAAVRVSLIAFSSAGDPMTENVCLAGEPVSFIHSDLTAKSILGSGVNLTEAVVLKENKNVAFVGTVKSGAFDISGEEARLLLQLPLNPNGRPNSDVICPWANGIDLVRRPQDRWIIDFGIDMSKEDAALYEAPFQIIVERVKPTRSLVRRTRYRNFWWLQAEPCSGMRGAVAQLRRFIVTPALAKHRVFGWIEGAVQPDHQLIAIARDDDAMFGVLHSRFHELWALRLGTSLEDRPRYTPSTTFGTFPFPEGLTPDIPAKRYADDVRALAIAAAARTLCEQRDNWLNPPDLVQIVPEVVEGYPDRILPRGDRSAAELKKRTLTNLYNQRPAWLDNAHRALDEAVAAAYGWPADLSDDEILKRLLDLNLERAAAQGGAGKNS